MYYVSFEHGFTEKILDLENGFCRNWNLWKMYINIYKNRRLCEVYYKILKEFNKEKIKRGELIEYMSIYSLKTTGWVIF